MKLQKKKLSIRKIDSNSS